MSLSRRDGALDCLPDTFNKEAHTEAGHEVARESRRFWSLDNDVKYIATMLKLEGEKVQNIPK